MRFAEETFELPPGAFPYESRFAEVMGARIHYVDEGNGPALLMVHGNPAWSFLFRHMIALLRDRFRCIAADLPGFGLSTPPAAFSFLPADHANVMAAFVDHLDLNRFSPMVQDWGGPIGLHVAARQPDRVERLIIGNTWAWPVNGDPHFELFSRVMGGAIGRFAIPRFNAFVNVFIPAGIKQRPVTAQLMNAYRRPLPTPERRMPSYIFPRSILRSRAFLAECKAALPSLAEKETLFVWGDADIAFRRKELTAFERLLPRHTTVILKGAGHYVWEDAPETIATALRNWWPAE